MHLCPGKGVKTPKTGNYAVHAFHKGSYCLAYCLYTIQYRIRYDIGILLINDKRDRIAALGRCKVSKTPKTGNYDIQALRNLVIAPILITE